MRLVPGETRDRKEVAVSGLYENPPHLVPDQTTGSQHALSMTRRSWRQVVVIYALLVCTPLLFVYSNFRAHGGDAFSAVVLKMQEGRGHGGFKMFYSLWAWDLTLQPGQPTNVHILLSYGHMPDELTYPSPSAPVSRYRATVSLASSSLYVDVDTVLSQSEFKGHYYYPEFVQRIVDQFTAPPRVALGEALRTRMGLLPYVVRNAVLSFLDFLPTRDACILATILGVPGLPILALLVLVPFWLALPVFWLWVVLSVLYVVLPQRAWRWIKAGVVRASANLRRKETR